jgi:hypothetical protein
MPLQLRSKHGGHEYNISPIKTVLQLVIFELKTTESLLSYDPPHIIYLTPWNAFPVTTLHELPEIGLITISTINA